MLHQKAAEQIPEKMATKKFSTFEYAALADTGKSGISGLIRYDVFETPYGYAFVFIINKENTNNQVELSRLAMNRISYYLKNAPDEKTEYVTQNALIYLSGYLYQYCNKNPEYKAGKVSCMCVLLHDEKVYYSCYGSVELLIFTGKRFYLLDSHYSGNDESLADRSLQQHYSANYLGHQAIIRPFAAATHLEPVADDKLIIIPANLAKHLNTKETKRILCDNMPLQTKAVRIIRELRKHEDDTSFALTLVRFYGFQRKERKLPPGQLITKQDVVKKSVEIPVNHQNKAKEKKSNKSHAMIRNILYAVGLIIVGYLFYDLFIKDPHPPISLPDTLRTVDWQTTLVASDTLQDDDHRVTPVLPDDVIYLVRGGDTWGRIYTQFGVCSWFIINHPPNKGRFGREGSLLAGQRLRIPVRYSGKPEYNPYYYREFATEKVGDRCENAGMELRQAFEEKIKEQ